MLTLVFTSLGSLGSIFGIKDILKSSDIDPNTGQETQIVSPKRSPKVPLFGERNDMAPKEPQKARIYTEARV